MTPEQAFEAWWRSTNRIPSMTYEFERVAWLAAWTQAQAQGRREGLEEAAKMLDRAGIHRVVEHLNQLDNSDDAMSARHDAKELREWAVRFRRRATAQEGKDE